MSFNSIRISPNCCQNNTSISAGKELSSYKKDVIQRKKQLKICNTVLHKSIDVNRNFMIGLKFKQTGVFFILACLGKNEFEVFKKFQSALGLSTKKYYKS